MASFHLVIAEQPGYAHAVVTGPNTEENIAGYIEQVLRECASRQCRQMLIEERLEGSRLYTMKAYQIAAQGASRAKGRFDKIAYVDVNSDGGGLLRFAATLAADHGIPVRVFATVAEARQWLEQAAGRDGPP